MVTLENGFTFVGSVSRCDWLCRDRHLSTLHLGNKCLHFDGAMPNGVGFERKLVSVVGLQAGMPQMHSQDYPHVDEREHGHDLLRLPESRCLLAYSKAFFETPHCIRWRISRSECLPRGHWQECHSRGVASTPPCRRVQPLERQSHGQMSRCRCVTAAMRTRDSAAGSMAKCHGAGA